MKDALAFGGACISLLNHADRVKAACLAQLVNAIAPIMTETGGPAWRQTIFFPFADFSNLGRGTVLRCEVDCPTYAAEYYDPRGTTDIHIPIPEAPYLKIAAVYSESESMLTLFLLNRSLDDEMPVDIAVDGFSNLAVGRATTLVHKNFWRPAIRRNHPTQLRRQFCPALALVRGRSTYSCPRRHGARCGWPFHDAWRNAAREFIETRRAWKSAIGAVRIVIVLGAESSSVPRQKRPSIHVLNSQPVRLWCTASSRHPSGSMTKAA